MKFRQVFESIKARFWVIPLLIVSGAVILSIVVRYIPFDVRLPNPLASILFDASTENSRQILSAIATSLMTVVGVLFSILVVVLQQVSSQYNPRVIEKFIRSGLSQVVLGTFIGTFVFCLLILRQIPVDPDESEYIPHLGTNIGIVSALGCMVLLIHFIQNILHSIRSTRVVAGLRDEAIRSLRDYREQLWTLHDDAAEPAGGGDDGDDRARYFDLVADSTGNLQSYDIKRLHRALRSKDVQVEIRVLPGDYVLKGGRLARVRSRDAITDECLRAAARAFHIGEFRTHDQDVRFSLRQMVDIALRALSPSLNDPTTAIEAINGLGSVLLNFICERGIPESIRLKDGSRIQFQKVTLRDLLHLSFSQIVSSADNQVAVLRMVMDRHLDLLEAVSDPEDEKILKVAIGQLASDIQRKESAKPYLIKRSTWVEGEMGWDV